MRFVMTRKDIEALYEYAPPIVWDYAPLIAVGILIALAISVYKLIMYLWRSL